MGEKFAYGHSEFATLMKKWQQSPRSLLVGMQSGTATLEAVGGFLKN